MNAFIRVDLYYNLNQPKITFILPQTPKRGQPQILIEIINEQSPLLNRLIRGIYQIDFIKMAYRQKNESFRKEIRRNQLDEIFQSKRLKLMSEHSDKMETEEPCLIKKEDLQTMDLRSIARLTQTRSGVEIMNEANYSQYIIKFLSSTYLNTDEQLYASYILCNLSVFSKMPPPIQHITLILQLLEEITNQKVAEYLLDTIANTISEFQVIKSDLVNNSALVERVIATFGRFQSPVITLCLAVSSCIIHMLNLSEAHPSFKKLRQTLLRFLLMIPKKETLRIIKQASSSFQLLTNMFPFQLLDYLIKGKIFQRLYQLYSQLQDISFAYFAFKTVDHILNDMKDTDFKRLILPFIENLSNSQFYINNVSKVNCLTIKQQAYKLINQTLESRKIQANTFVICDLGKRMLEEFQVQENQEIRKQFMFIFTTVYFDIDSQQVKNSIEKSMHRMRQLDHKDMVVASHINQLQVFFYHH